jgi:hypothetical protein
MQKFHVHELSEGLCSSPRALECLEILDPYPVGFGIHKSLDPVVDSVKCLDSDSVFWIRNAVYGILRHFYLHKTKHTVDDWLRRSFRIGFRK